MKGQAVPSKYQQRKEAQRKENIMLKRRKREEDNREMPSRIGRAAIYLCEPRSGDSGEPLGSELSIEQQRVMCRHLAAAIYAEVVEEFVDHQPLVSPRPGVLKMVDLALQEPRLDYLIVSSQDRLASCVDDAFEVAWWLGFASTVVIPADGEEGFPWPV